MIEIRKVIPEDIPTVYAMGENIDEFHTSDQAPTSGQRLCCVNALIKMTFISL